MKIRTLVLALAAAGVAAVEIAQQANRTPAASVMTAAGGSELQAVEATIRKNLTER